MSEFTETAVQKSLQDLHTAIAEGNKIAELKINDFLDQAEKKNQELMLRLAKEEEASQELKKFYLEIEAKLQRTSTNSSECQDLKSEMKNFDRLIRDKNYFEKTKEEKGLRTDSNLLGGYLINPQISNEIIKNITEISLIRNMAKNVPLSASRWQQIVRSATGAVGLIGERQIISTSTDSTYGEVVMYSKKIGAKSTVTIEMLQDSTVDIQNQIMQDVSEVIGQIQGQQFVNGSNSANDVEGFMNNVNVGTTTSASLTTLADALIKVQGDIKTAYTNRAVFGLNRKTIAAIRALKTSGSGEYIFSTGNFADNKPNLIAGIPYIEIPDMPDLASASKPIILADWKSFYAVGIRNEMTMLRDDYTSANTGEVNFFFWTRFGGCVIKPEAGRTITLTSI
jgi:HK97 family phage major capsid protein